MPRPISSGFTQIELLTPDEPYDPEARVALHDESAARTFLERFLLRESDMQTLRDFFAARVCQAPVPHVSDHEVLEALARSIAAGDVIVVRQPVFLPSGGAAERTEPEEPVPAGPPVTETEHWIKFRVVDDETGDPVPGVVLSIRPPNGLERSYTTRPDGMIEIDEIDAGTCDIVSISDDDVLEVVRLE